MGAGEIFPLAKWQPDGHPYSFYTSLQEGRVVRPNVSFLFDLFSIKDSPGSHDAKSREMDGK